MTIGESYRSFLLELKNIYDPSEASNITDMVFEGIAGVTRSGLIKDPTSLLNSGTESELAAALAAIKEHKPVQYVLGEAWFYKMKLKVSPAVLIPRPETEELVEIILNNLKQKPAATVLDIGTGSGCIVIALKKNSAGINATAIDVSSDALIIAKTNALEQEVGINFLQLNFLDEAALDILPVFDMIVSNPPYIPEAEKEILDKNVTNYEPHLALFVDNTDALIFYRKIALFAELHLAKEGMIFMETHEAFAEQAASLFVPENYSVEIKVDMNGKQRMLVVTRRYR